MLDIFWRDSTGRTGTATALLEDIAPSGACLQLESPIPLASEVSWRAPRQQFKGHVRYCVYREIGYFVGVEFDSSVRWSSRTFKPQHMLNLQSLVGRR